MTSFMNQWARVLLPFRRDCLPGGLKKRIGGAVAKKQKVLFGVLVYHMILIISCFSGKDALSRSIYSQPSARRWPPHGTFGRWVVEEYISYRNASVSSCMGQQPGT